jgi:protease PrsW
LANEPRPSGRILLCQTALLVGLLLYVGAARAIEALWLPTAEPVGWPGALALVLVPALLWLAYFYLLDRYEPEPTHYVLSAFLLGALVAAPLAHWMIRDLFALDRWGLTPFSTTHVAASFLVVGTTQELMKYLVVRYTVYLSDEFDEPADGIVYSTAAGIGFATRLNFGYVSSGVLLTTGAINVTITTLAHACFAGAAGYALGRAKFAARGGQRTLAVGLLAAIALNGAFTLLQELVLSAGQLRPWRGLALSGTFAALVFGVVSLLMHRALRPTAPSAAEGRP